ncbi:MAG TPA: TetR/AcrR family transcriptional regulator [Acidisoma sp.]|jgi:AcrR family transcriptional regulator|uniref:TetR/AcrR family transcriptional regulator n=1 Tax=Acidisoma sp. TaxID=1872115 RepID=UPI002C3D5352|nr:TetR/AcrR family transcriptional regulator [Acidisoma sp.]HTI00803.1 TetR/AcrR family transcriptional regulator [Acidisoma sp.]
MVKLSKQTAGPAKPETSQREIKSALPRDPERTSAAILAASTKEFAEKGYGGARINAIAERAGTNKRMLYHYFGGKEALYLAVLEGSYMQIRSAETKLQLDKRDPEDGMRELVLFTWRYYLDHPEFLSLLHTENLHRAKFLKRSARIFDLNSPLVAQTADLLRRGAEKGVFRPGTDPVKVYISIAALGFFYLSNRWTLSTIFRRDLGSKAETDAWGEHIVQVVLASLR